MDLGGPNYAKSAPKVDIPDSCNRTLPLCVSALFSRRTGSRQVVTRSTSD